MHSRQLLRFFLSAIGCALSVHSVSAASDPRFGVMTHFAQGWDNGWAWQASARSITAVRDELYWEAVEPRKGIYIFPAAYDSYMATLRAAGISPLIILSFENSNYDGGNTPYTDEAMTAYGRYGVQVLKHYGSQIKSLEIWNEYNGSFCKGPATNDRSGTYARMLANAYGQIKAARPDVTVLGGSTVGVPLPYWEKLMQAGALSSMDALAVHPYRYNSAPEGIETDIFALQDLIKKYNNGKSKPIWVTEVGWAIQDATNGQLAIDEATQAKFLVRAYSLLLSAGVERVYWYLLRDYNEFNMGLIKSDTGLKISATAMQTMIAQLAGATFVKRESTLESVYSLLFTKANGSQVRVLWAVDPVTVTLNGATGITGIVPAVGTAPKNNTAFTLGDAPLFITGNVTGLPAPKFAADKLLTTSSTGFTNTQQKNGWSYGAFVGGSTTFETLTQFATSDWTQIWSSQYPYLSVTPSDQHPSTANNVPVAAVRRWESNYSGNIHLVGQFVAGTGGDGVGVSIFIDGQRLSRTLIGGSSGTNTYKFDLVQSVNVGSHIDFAVDPGAGLDISYDATAFAVAINSTLASVTDSASAVSSLAPTPAPAAAIEKLLTTSTTGFSSVQQGNSWSYGARVDGSTVFETLTQFSTNPWTQVWSGQYPYLSITPSDQHPSITNNVQVAAVRRWDSTYSGNIHLVGQFGATTDGDGVGVSITVDGQRLSRTLIGGSNAATTTYKFDLVQPVHVGSHIDFGVDPGPGLNINYDATTFAVSISSQP